MSVVEDAYGGASQVLRDTAGSELPFTGLDLWLILLVALSLVVLGIALRQLGKAEG